MRLPLFPERRRVSVWLLALCLPLAADAGGLQVPGVANLQKVNDEVYRGAQPTDLGFANLAQLGIRIVVDLRPNEEHSQADEQRLVEAAGMRYVSVPMKGMATPTDEQISRVLGLLDDSSAGPVFVHCQRGADRTGAVIACYRVGHDHWQNKQALGEARSYGMSWYQHALQQYVLHYQPPASPDVAVHSAG
jgi:tyrosine-protein phosphatase SIW14